ncbi:hypothetical protein M513_13854 [Trichuris suis]|uniref:Uncharacterized protein n=1 Tax=Trichuris suis TaxID=68888 RepID=A0A085LJX4_9BILA|nr:hypothetical protein M513_13854 [Trichuris suis]
MQNGFPRSQNSVEAWHRRWESLVGGPHVGLYRMIEEFRREQRHVHNECEPMYTNRYPSLARENDFHKRNEAADPSSGNGRSQTTIEWRSTKHNIQET